MDQSDFCQHCGAALRATSKFCSKCGKPVVQSAQPQPPSVAQPPRPAPQQGGWDDMPPTDAAPPDFTPAGDVPKPAAVHIPEAPLPSLDETDQFEMGGTSGGERKSLLRRPLFWIGCIGLLVVVCCLVVAVVAYSQYDRWLDFGGGVDDIFNTVMPELENMATEMPAFEQLTTEIPESEALPSIMPELESIATELPSLEDLLP